MAAATCREEAGQTNLTPAEDVAGRPAPLPARVRLHPDVYALLARWMLEDMRKRAEMAT